MQNTISDYLKKLNHEQLLPVEDTEGAVLVIAGAGSGKTRVLTTRIAYLVMEKGVPPEEILAITFTNKAADEMRARVDSMIEGGTGRMWVSTIHSMCVRILRANIDALGFNSSFSIYSDVDKDRVLKRIFASLEYDEKNLKNINWHISNAKNKGQSPEEYERESKTVRGIETIKMIYSLYQTELKKSNSLDFDDLLVKTYELLSSHPEVLEYYTSRFKYILVDEFQDTNVIQYNIIKLLASKNGNLFAVGDDDQSIYGWRGAEIMNILNFETEFKGAKTYKLERNYRSTKKILALANTIIANNSGRREKTLWTENDGGVKIEYVPSYDEGKEATYVATQIRALMDRGYTASSFAILMRINALSRAFEQEFLKYGIPYKVFGGFRFYERKEIKDLTAYLRVLNNPLDDESVLRIINTPKRGIGDKTVDGLIRFASDNNKSVFDAIMSVESLGLSSGATQKIVGFRNLIIELLTVKSLEKVSDIVDAVIKKSGILDMYNPSDDEDESKIQNIYEYKNSALEFDKLNEDSRLSDFLNSITLSSDIDQMDASEYVTVATVHAVKGLEFRAVFIVGLEDGIFPISRAIGTSELEEERRLMYVAITRSRERLYLTCAKSRFLNGNRSYTTESRFIGEMSSDLNLAKKQEIRPSYRDDYMSGEDDYRSSDAYSSSYAQKYNTSNAKQNGSGYKVGCKVVHTKFGEGTVIMLRGSGDGLIADVAFKGLGVKSLSVKFAPMKCL